MKISLAVLRLAPWGLLTGATIAQIQPEFLASLDLSSRGDLISADGSRVAGRRSDLPSQVVWWNLEDGTEISHPSAPLVTFLEHMSADGTSVVGRGGSGGDVIVWRIDGTSDVVGSLFGNQTFPYGLSRDGSTVVGMSLSPNNIRRAFRWSEGVGIQNLGTLNGPGRSEAFAVSTDGDVAVGMAFEAGVPKAFVWTGATGMTALPIPSPSAAYGVSADGVTIFGLVKLPTSIGTRRSPFLWTAANGLTILGPANSNEPQAMVLSEDGTAAAWNFLASSSTSHWDASATEPLVEIPGWDLVDMSDDGKSLVLTRRVGEVYESAYWSRATGLVQMLESPLGGRVEPNDISYDGSRISGKIRPDSSSPFSLATLWSPAGEIGVRYCGPAIPNSTGSPGELSATGTNLISAGALTLQASSLPAGTLGFFLGSQVQASVLPVANSQGRLCVGGAIGRYVGPGQVMNSGPDGAFGLLVPLNALATPMGFVSAVPGETWNFQAWHRDANPMTTSNFTNGVRVTLF